MKKHIPNLFTLFNLSFGFLSVVLVLNNCIVYAGYLIFVASIFDFLDGFLARKLNVNSELGEHLDSLADLISFGVAPAIVLYSYLKQLISENSSQENWRYLALVVVLIPVMSAIRLAMFNIDKQQKNEFLGLPTPANALFFTSLVVYLNTANLLFINDTSVFYLLIGLTIVFSLLLIYPTPYFSLKFTSFIWVENKIKFIFIFISAILLCISIFFDAVILSMSIIILLYMIISFINNLIFKTNEI